MTDLMARNSAPVKAVAKRRGISIASQALGRLRFVEPTKDMDEETIVIQSLDENVKPRFRKLSTRKGLSMDEEVRATLREAVGREDASNKGFQTAIHEPLNFFGVDELELLPPALYATTRRWAPATLEFSKILR
ncbi:MAG: hypothetical protein OXI87_21540 [Albidovulum sp.]|nr:hypothetical protein [Albidovulum sp.]MDE0533954.1 hypothetical protein [Albidovulum sp.]